MPDAHLRAYVIWQPVLPEDDAGGGAEAGREAFGAAGNPPTGAPELGTPHPKEDRAKRCPSERQGRVKTPEDDAGGRRRRKAGDGRSGAEAGQLVVELGGTHSPLSPSTRNPIAPTSSVQPSAITK